MFVETFIPFILEIVGKYFNQTQGNNPSASEQETQVIDGFLLKACLDLLCNILKNVKSPEEKLKVVRVFPQLLEYIK